MWAKRHGKGIDDIMVSLAAKDGKKMVALLVSTSVTSCFCFLSKRIETKVTLDGFCFHSF